MYQLQARFLRNLDVPLICHKLFKMLTASHVLYCVDEYVD